MFDPIAQALQAAASASPCAFPLAFSAGLLSSVGPCVAPRFIAVAGLSSNRMRRTAVTTTACFVAGLVCAYASFGAAAGLIVHVAQLSSWIYAAVAGALLVSGIHALWGEENNAHRCGRPPIRSHGAAFFLGASFALVVSPCCTPLVLGILAYSSATGNAWYGSALLACFAVGHSVPLLAAAGGTHGAGAILERCGARRAAGVLGAGLMLALAGYYAVLV